MSLCASLLAEQRTPFRYPEPIALDHLCSPLCVPRQVAVGLPMLRTLPRVTWHALRVLLRPRHRGERRELLTSRPVQFGFKVMLLRYATQLLYVVACALQGFHFGLTHVQLVPVLGLV